MHGLVNRALQCYLRDTYGAPFWAEVAREAQLGFDSFETLMIYDIALTEAVLTAAARLLDAPRDSLLEDLGTYLVSHRTGDPLRRLLRFGGVTFADFLHSLDDLPGRARLALPDLDLPQLELASCAPGRFALTCRSPLPGMGHALVGLLRAMADDYGALVLLNHQGGGPEGEVISISLFDTAHGVRRGFPLAMRAG